MKTNNLLFTALTALALCVLAGCSTETEFPQEAPDTIPPGVSRIEFAIKGVKTGTSYADGVPTVALEENERTINDVTAYLFKLEGNAVLNDNSVVTEVMPTLLGANTGKGSFDLGKSTAEARYAVVLIANKACFNSTLAAVTKTSNTTYAALNAIETVENTTIMAGLETLKGLPMRALTNIIVPAGGGKVAIDAKFTRPLSRFDIDNRAVHSFYVESVKLKNGRKTSPLNVPSTANVVATGGTSDIDYTSLLSEVNNVLDTPNADGSKTQLRPAFYVAPALSADGASLEVTGQLRVGATYYTRTYTVPLISKDTNSAITLGVNKRYRLTLLMDKDDYIVGEITLDLGEWADTYRDPDVAPDLDLQVNTASITEGVTYTTSTRTFNVPFGTTSFQFEMLNDQGLDIATDGTLVTAVTAVDAPVSRGVNATTYNVALGTQGKGHFTFTTAAGKQHKFNVVMADVYPGTSLAPIEANGILWAPVNVGATNINEPGTLFQYGRMYGWPTAFAAVGNNDLGVASKLKIDEEALPGNKTRYFTGGGSTPTNWWPDDAPQEQVDALMARWSAVSDGTNNPCPMGWRLPTIAEAQALLADQTPVIEELTEAAVTKFTVRGVTFLRKESISASYYGSANNSVSYYWLASSVTDAIQCTRAVEGFSPAEIRHVFKEEYQSYTYSATGAYIRCVKDKPVTP